MLAGLSAPTGASAADGQGAAALARIAAAVENAESSGGTDPLMWRFALSGPQGPMQVSAAAAADAGGGNRWNIGQNLILGRSYLALLYRRFGNWPDAVTAYNWGPSNLDQWIKEGRPPDLLSRGVRSYRNRVLSASGVGAGEDSRVNGFAEPSRPPIRSAMRDPKLRRRFADNRNIIRDLRDRLAHPTHPRRLAALVVATILKIARWPDHGVFGFLAHHVKESTLTLDSSRALASMLIAKLDEENDMLPLLDRYEHSDVVRPQPQKHS